MAVVNITVANDADFYRLFLYKTISGPPVDLTDAEFVMMLRRHAKDSIALMQLSTDSGEIVVVDPTGGVFSLLVPQPRLVELPLGPYDQSLVMTLHGVKQQIWSGLFTINAGPSR